MSAPFTPIDLSAGYADVSALLQLLVDPLKSQARLDELIAADASAKQRIAEADAREAETRRLLNTAKATNIVSENRKTALDAREAELDARAGQLEQSESTRSDAALRRRENLVEARENAAKAEADRLSAMRKDYEAKLGKIKNLTSSLG